MKRILLVDDETRRMASTIEIFKESGFDISHIDTKEKAIIALKNQKYDIIILDIMMPTDNPIEDEYGLFTGMNLGIFVRNTMNIKTPIVFYTAINNSKVFRNLKELENVYFVPKPTSVLSLIEKIDSILIN